MNNKKIQVVFPGTFSPPTYGHLEIIKKVSNIFPEVVIVCSANSDKSKGRWFEEDESASLWRYYNLPKNIKVTTFAKAKNTFNFAGLIMVRGVREEADFEHEKKVVMKNHAKLGIDKVFYCVADEMFAKTSSSRVRRAARDLDFVELAKHVSPMVVTAVLEKSLGIKNLFMVVGQPGSGKSTFLKKIQSVSKNNVWIDTDKLSGKTKPILYEKFGAEADLIKVMTEREAEATELIAGEWFSLLAEELRSVPKDINVFLEVPYGLKPEKDMYKYLGGKIIYVGCKDGAVNCQRLAQRGTSQHKLFIDQIPDLERTRQICKQNKLELKEIDSSDSIEGLQQQAKTFFESL